MPKVVVNRPSPGPGTNHRTAGVISRISPIGFDPKEGIKILIYGRSGTGKTTLWSTFPKPILAILCSGGDNPGELRSIDTPKLRTQVSQVVLRHSSEVGDLAQYLLTSSGKARYATVVLDHVTGLQDLVLKEILGLDEVPVSKAWGLASQQQYGQCTLQCKELLRQLLSLSCNVVVVGQEREFRNDDPIAGGGVVSDVITPFVGVGLMPSLAGWLNTATDYITQTFLRQGERIVRETVAGKPTVRRVKTGKVEFCLRTGPHPVFTTKFRLPRGTPLPDCVVDADYGKIISLVGGVLGGTGTAEVSATQDKREE